MKQRLGAVPAAILCAALLWGCAGNTSNESAPTFVSDYHASDYVTLGDYKDMEIQTSMTAYSFSNEEIDEQIEALMLSESLPIDLMPTVEKDTPAEDGDLLDVDYSGRIKETDEVFSGGTTEHARIRLGDGGFVDGFEEGMRGMVPGETREAELTFPEDYTEELAGKEVIFTFTLHRFIELPEVEGEVASTLGESVGIEGVTNREELRQAIRDAMSSYYFEAQGGYEALQAQLLQQIQDACEYKEIPKAFHDRFVNRIRQVGQSTAEEYSALYGQDIDPDEYLSTTLSSYGFTGELDEMIDQYATRMGETLLMYQAIADAEGITLSEEEVQAYVDEVMESEDYESVEALNEAEGTDLAKEAGEMLMMEQVRAFLFEHNTAVSSDGTMLHFAN